MQAGRGIRDGIDEAQDPLPLAVRQPRAGEDGLPVDLLAVAEDGRIALRRMQLLAHPSEAACHLNRPFRFFGDDAREGALALDALEVQRRFASVCIERTDQRSGQAEEHHRAGDGFLPRDERGGHVGAIDLDHGVPVGTVVGLGHIARPEFLIL